MEPEPPDETFLTLSAPYRQEMEFAFFAVNFGYSKRDYADLTAWDKAFIYKAYETKVVSETSLIRDAVLNAVVNALRKKGKRFVKLWKKRQRRADKNISRNNLRTILDIEQKETGWIDRIYQENGWKPPERRTH